MYVIHSQSLLLPFIEKLILFLSLIFIRCKKNFSGTLRARKFLSSILFSESQFPLSGLGFLLYESGFSVSGFPKPLSGFQNPLSGFQNSFPDKDSSKINPLNSVSCQKM